MKQSFKHYLVESKKLYSYKVGLAGDLPENAVDKLETVMQKFKLASMSKGKKTPIQERPLDFPNLQNTRATYFDLETEYPTTPQILEQYLQNTLGMDPAHVIVRDPNAPQEQEQEPKDNKPYEAMLDTDYEASKDEQKTAGDNRVMELLKELEKDRKDRSAPDAASGIKPGGNVLPNEGDSKNEMSPISGKQKGK
jgi:hypothetical protein